MAKRRQIIEIYAPTAGLRYDAPSTIIDPRSQPNGLNGKMYYGVNQKEFGTSLYATGTDSVLGAPINFLYDAAFPDASLLEVFTHTGVYKYTAGLDGFVSDGQAFTGEYKDFWNGILYNDQFYYTNGIDNIQVKPTIAATGDDFVSAVSTTTYKAWALGALREHLNLYHTIENGSEFPKRVRWTTKGVIPATTAFSTGLAGAIDVVDCEGGIQTALPLGGAQAIYAERSITIQYWVGGDEVYRFEKTISGIGTPSRRGAVGWRDINWVFSHDNIYEYRGGDDLRAIGDPIKREVFSTINQSAMAQVFAEYDDKEQEVLFHVPTGTSTRPDTTWVYRIPDKAWSKLRRPYTAYGRFTRRTGLTIGELIGNIGAQNFKFGDASAQEESLTRLYGDQSGRIVKVDQAVYSISESGTSQAQSYIYETPDLTGIGLADSRGDKQAVEFITTDKRWQQVNVELAGNGEANLSYSVDRGSTYIPFPQSPLSLVSTATSYSVDVDERSPTFRVRITNTATNEYIAVGYLKVELQAGSEQEK